MRRGDSDPLDGYVFLLEIDGTPRAGFSECTGLRQETDVTDCRHESKGGSATKLPGPKKVGNVTLERGIVTERDILDWCHASTEGAGDRRDVSIVMLDEQRRPRVRWELSCALPVKWTGPTLKANASEVAIEELVLCFEGIRIRGVAIRGGVTARVRFPGARRAFLRELCIKAG